MALARHDVDERHPSPVGRAALVPAAPNLDRRQHAALIGIPAVLLALLVLFALGIPDLDDGPAGATPTIVQTR